MIVGTCERVKARAGGIAPPACVFAPIAGRRQPCFARCANGGVNGCDEKREGKARMIHIVGAGSGAADLITLRGARLLRAADVVVWAGSLVNPELLAECKESCIVYDSAHMTLEEVLDVMCAADARGEEVVRLHTGDPCLYGAIQEQMDALDARGVDYEVVPGVSSFCGAAAALRQEYTLPGISQSVVITRLSGRTPMPAGEGHGATMGGKRLRTMVIIPELG